MSKKVTFFTEGGKKYGLGHIVRCDALAQAFIKLGHKPELIIAGDNSFAHIINSAYKIVDWHTNKEFIENTIFNTDICIVDSYATGQHNMHWFTNSNTTFAFFDDTNRIIYPEGNIINGSVHAKHNLYSNQNNVQKLLVGLEYQCVREAFLPPIKKIINQHINNILISIGGNDVHNIIPNILKCIHAELLKTEIHVVINKSSQNFNNIVNLESNNIKIHNSIPANKMHDLITNADVAISNGGQSLCELAICGTPTIAICIANNQEEHVNGWYKNHAIEYVGYWNSPTLQEDMQKCIKKIISVEHRKALSLTMHNLIDGNGAINIAQVLLQ